MVDFSYFVVTLLRQRRGNMIEQVLATMFEIQEGECFYVSMTYKGFHFTVSGDNDAEAEGEPYHVGVGVGNGVQLHESGHATVGEAKNALRQWYAHGPKTWEEVNPCS